MHVTIGDTHEIREKHNHQITYTHTNGTDFTGFSLKTSLNAATQYYSPKREGKGQRTVERDLSISFDYEQYRNWKRNGKIIVQKCYGQSRS